MDMHMNIQKYCKIVILAGCSVIAGSVGYFGGFYIPTTDVPCQEETIGQTSYALKTAIDLPQAPKTSKNMPTSSGSSKKSCSSHSHHLGFSSLRQESSKNTLSVQGSMPEWLSGSFITVGPGVFELNDSKASHWLDGFAMIHQFCLDGKKVAYSNKIINSGYYQECCKNGKLRGSGPEKKKSAFSKLASALSSNPANRPKYDNTNVNIAVFDNELVSLTETPQGHLIDKDTLETKCCFNYNDNLETHVSSAHPLFDEQTQEWFGIATQYAHTSNYVIYKMKAGSTTRIPIATIPSGYPSYMHSFALTKDYIILTQAPFMVSPYDLLMSDNSYIENFTWKPKNGTTFIVINRNNGKKIRTFKTEPFFTLHHVNAYQKNNEIVIDLIAYKDPQITAAFTISNLRSNQVQLPAGKLKRYTIDQESGKVAVQMLCPYTVELPHINGSKLTKDYQFVYATGAEQGFAQQLFKFDLHATKQQPKTWACKGCYPTEAIFVPKPGAKTEDDGVLLSLVLDAPAQKSFLLALDAKTFKELGRAYVPHHIPFTSHSKFFKL